MPGAIAAVVVDHDAGPLLEGAVRSILSDGGHPVVVVENGAPGSTEAALSDLLHETSPSRVPVRIVRPGRNVGYGGGVNRGLAALAAEPAPPEWVLVSNADLEYDPQDWPKLLKPILDGKARVVYGSRFTGERKNMLPLHWFGNRLLSLVTNVLYNSTLSDMETCYKLFDAQVLEGMTIVSNRFDFEPEITAKVLRRGHRIYEVPISYAGREPDEGKKITWRDGFSALWALVKFRFTKE